MAGADSVVPMATACSDSDDECTIVKEIKATREINVARFQRLLKKPKVEVGATSAAIVGATTAVAEIPIRLGHWPPLSSELGFYGNDAHMKNLESGKLLEFLSASLVRLEIQEQLVAEFLSTYQLGARVSVVRGKRLDLTAEVVSRALQLPNCGVSWTSLKVEQYPIGGCFETPNPSPALTESNPETPVKVWKTQLTIEWREMVEFVQRWLFLDVDPVSVDVEVVVATVALFGHGITINWAKLMARRLHQLVEDAQINQFGGLNVFHGGYFITKIFNVAHAVSVASVKMETTPLGAQSVLPGVPAPLRGPDYYQALAREASSQLAMLSAHPSIFEDYTQLQQKYAILQAERQLLQTEAEQLKKALADAASSKEAAVEQLKKAMADSADVVANAMLEELNEVLADSSSGYAEMVTRLQEALADSARERAELVELRSQLERCKAKAVDQKNKYVCLNIKHIQSQTDAVAGKQKIEELTILSQNLERQLLALRNGNCIGDAEDIIESPPRVQRGALSSAGLLELSAYIPPAQNLERAYTYDRQVFFLQNGLAIGQTLSKLEFQQIWEWAEGDNQEDLLVEILVRGDLKLEDYVAAYWLIGDLGVRLLRYYRQLEEIQVERHRLEMKCAENVWKPKCSQWGEVVASALATNWDACSIEEWQSLLQTFLDEFQSEEWLLQMIKFNQARLVRTRFTDIHPSEYFYTYRDTKIRLERLVMAKSFSQMLPFEIHTDAVFKNKYNWQVAPEAVVGMPVHLDSWSFGTSASITDSQFLGKWENLFGTVDDRSDTLLWEALLWIGKDYNHKQSALSKPIEALIAGESNHRLGFGEVLEQVAENPYWCSTSERRYKWQIDAQLDTVWYNWPVTPGVWGSSVECVTSYTQFWQEHKNHRDPVCFRAAIFCKALAEWCQFFKIIIDPRLGGRMLQDGELYARLNYSCCRKMRLLELMFMMQFLQGAHHNFIGDKKANRKGAMESFLHRDRDGSLKRERANWRQLSVECHNANREARRRGGSRPLYQMPLQWTPGCNLLLIPYEVSSKSARPVKQEATLPIGTKSKK